MFFDNVGGDILDAALTQLAPRARIIICGAISQYNNTAPVKGPSNYLSLLVNRASMTGMVVFDYAARYPAAIAEMAQWVAAGKLRSREDIVPRPRPVPPGAAQAVHRREPRQADAGAAGLKSGHRARRGSR